MSGAAVVSDNDEIQHIIELRKIKRQVLRKLEEQEARYAGCPPTHVSIEIEQVRQDIKLFDARLQTVPHSQEAVNAVGGDTLGITVAYRLKEIEEKVSGALQAFTVTQAETRSASEEWRRIEFEIRKERQQETDARFTELERNARATFDQIARLGQRFDWIVWNIIIIVLAAYGITIVFVWWLR